MDVIAVVVIKLMYTYEGLSVSVEAGELRLNT